MGESFKDTESLHLRALQASSSHGGVGTVAIFARAMVTYGWIERSPGDRFNQRFNVSAWGSLGKLRNSLKPLRNIVGTFMEVEPAHFINVIRLKLRKDRWISMLGLPPVTTGLDYAYLDLLEKFGWFHDGSAYHHQVLDYTFKAEDVTDKLAWRKAAHALTELSVEGLPRFARLWQVRNQGRSTAL